MNKLEKLEQEISDNNVQVHQTDFSGTRIKGLYIDGNIALSKDIDTSTEKACILAEELGHHHTTVGDIIDLNCPANAKQERQARLWAYNKQIGLRGLIDAYESDCQDRHELAEHLDVTDEFLTECICCYRDKYGAGVTVDNYYIMFIPNLQILKLL